MKAAVKETNPHLLARALQDMALQLLQKRPFVIWGASLVLVLLTGGIALRGLISPGSLEPTTPEVTVTQAKTPQAKAEAKAKTEKALNLWLFGAIGLGCAAGSFLLSKHLEQMEPQQQARKQPSAKRTKPRATVVRPSKQSQAHQRPSVRRRQKSAGLAGMRRAVVPNPAIVYAEAQSHLVKPVTSENLVQEPIVTVVPENESHPLDWGQASLADMMDLRKQRPLSHWL